MRRRGLDEATRANAAARMREKLARELDKIAAPSRQALLLAIAAEWEVEAGVLTGSRRFPHLVDARAAFAFLARKRLGSTVTRIAATLGVHHASVINAFDIAERRLADPEFADRIARVEARLWPELRTCAA